jgi:copper chaperone CopZ
MIAESALHCLQSSEIVKIACPSSSLDIRLKTASIQALIAGCLVMFTIYTTPAYSQANSLEPVVQPEVRKPSSNNEKVTIASIRLSGSMCPACLKHLEEKLKQLGGVADVKITSLPEKAFRPSLKAEIHPHYKKALAEIVFNRSEIDTHRLVEAIKQNDFAVISVSCHKRKGSVLLGEDNK